MAFSSAQLVLLASWCAASVIGLSAPVRLTSSAVPRAVVAPPEAAAFGRLSTDVVRAATPGVGVYSFEDWTEAWQSSPEEVRASAVGSGGRKAHDDDDALPPVSRFPTARLTMTSKRSRARSQPSCAVAHSSATAPAALSAAARATSTVGGRSSGSAFGFVPSATRSFRVVMCVCARVGVWFRFLCDEIDTCCDVHTRVCAPVASSPPQKCSMAMA